MITFKMPVSQKDPKTSKYVEVGSVDVTVPVLSDIIPFMAAKETGVEEGVPVYDSPEANFVMSALMAYVKATARNKLVSKTAILKEGLSIPTTWAEFTAEGTRNGGEALAILWEAKADFADWLSTQGKSEAVVNTLVTLFNNRAALRLQTDANKAKVQKFVEQFAESLSEEKMERLARPIDAVLAACAMSTADAFAEMD